MKKKLVAVALSVALVASYSADIFGKENGTLVLLGDIIRQVQEGKLTPNQLQLFTEHRNPFGQKEAKKITSFKYDKTEDSWKLLEDVEFNGQPFVPDIVEFLKPGESYMNGEVMKQRAKELNAHLGQRHAEYLLEHQGLIPKEWRGKYYLVFPGTVWQARAGLRLVPCLRWYGGRWYLHFRWLDDDWDGSDRLVASRK